jgi:hypothetical protein
MPGVIVSRMQGRYGYKASQNPDGTWTVNVWRIGRAGFSGGTETEHLTYVSVKRPGDAKREWSAAARSAKA